MVKALFVGLLVIVMCGLPSCAPSPQIARINRPEASPPPQFIEDSAARSERSTNLSHITGTARKIQMFIKNRHLQLLPDGTVNGTLDDSSIYTILQRTTVGVGQLKIQAVGTCQYLCMDACGLPYGSREFSDECVFNEMIEQHHYNTYSSTKYSNERKTFYLALNKRGLPRKVLLRARQPLGRLSSFTRVLTRHVAPERVEELHPIRHHGHLCSTSESTSSRLSSSVADSESPSKCRKRKKRKKKKRKCLEGEPESELCHKKQNKLISINGSNSNVKKCVSDDSVECQRVEVTIKKKLKTKFSDKQLGGAKKKKNPKGIKNNRKNRLLKTTTEAPVVVTEDNTSDEDYIIDSTTSWDWEDSTVIPLPEESGTPHPD
ncbi:PREDICTED: uncharacterized protein LOC108557033 [Nicrophorus vespilloides]|uniref:Fibroblast growth factor n=1 Tax=Nicrophorus vespilloides TaxID=110193 RepID=A0ABM1M2U6_NICVS|nr:PREDICTED: uncharacterized protein LOC108557033 [Nicrophorus vespilloides]